MNDQLIKDKFALLKEMQSNNFNEICLIRDKHKDLIKEIKDLDVYFNQIFNRINNIENYLQKFKELNN